MPGRSQEVRFPAAVEARPVCDCRLHRKPAVKPCCGIWGTVNLPAANWTLRALTLWRPVDRNLPWQYSDPALLSIDTARALSEAGQVQKCIAVSGCTRALEWDMAPINAEEDALVIFV